MKDNLPENYLKSIRDNDTGRNDLGHNPEVLFQSIAVDKSVTRILYRLNDFSRLKVLDVGCGEGGSLLNLIRLGFDPSNLSGVDILDDKINKAKRKFPNIEFLNTDAANLPMPDCSFDLVMESTMFVQLTDDVLSRTIANEMIRVTKDEGFLMLVDWRYSKPWDKNYKGLSRKRLKSLFNIGTSTTLVEVKNGALVPFIGRFISKYCPAFYFLLLLVFPFLVGQVTYLLQKK